MEFLSSLAIGLTPAEFGYALLACLLAYIVLGVTGFGSSLILVVSLAQILPIQAVVAQVVFLDLFGTLYLGTKSFKEIARKEFSWLIIFNVIGLVIGISLLIKAPEKPLLAVLAAFVLFNGVSMLIQRNAGHPTPFSRWWGAPLGVIGGIFSALYGTGGPIFVVYLSHRLESFKQIRATVAALIFSNVFFRAVLLSLAGLLLTEDNVIRSLALIPICYVGLRLGSRMQRSITPSGFKTMFGLLLVVSALALVPKII
ncbi:MAG: sulfite exporter TauE/SafE family protein [Burkholderiaceae bacterium]|jgi:uncharacterized membrane protein YfcA